MKYLFIQGDTNDADYVATLNRVSDKELIQLEPMFKAIKDFKPYTVDKDGMKWRHTHNFPNNEFSPREDLGEKNIEQLYIESELVTEDVLGIFEEYAPVGIHSITEILVLDVNNVKKVFEA